MCCIICCTPCYKTCSCLYHVARSTPATSLLSMGLAIAVICIYNYYVPVVRSELSAAGLEIRNKLFDMLRYCVVLSSLFSLYKSLPRTLICPFRINPSSFFSCCLVISVHIYLYLKSHTCAFLLHQYAHLHV
jgi:hypothetical protein